MQVHLYWSPRSCRLCTVESYWNRDMQTQNTDAQETEAYFTGYSLMTVEWNCSVCRWTRPQDTCIFVMCVNCSETTRSYNSSVSVNCKWTMPRVARDSCGSNCLLSVLILKWNRSHSNKDRCAKHLH